MPNPEPLRDIVDVVLEITSVLDRDGYEYAVGGAVALGYWAAPRGTVDADLTVFLPADRLEEMLDVLQAVNCTFSNVDVLRSLKEHGFCRVTYETFQVDWFLPTVPFYELARARRQQVPLEGRAIQIWDAASLCVFKMMFFRLKDLADVEQIIRVQGDSLDHQWIEDQLISMYGARDPRCSQWREIVHRVMNEG